MDESRLLQRIKSETKIDDDATIEYAIKCFKDTFYVLGPETLAISGVIGLQPGDLTAYLHFSYEAVSAMSYHPRQWFKY